MFHMSTVGMYAAPSGLPVRSYCVILQLTQEFRFLGGTCSLPVPTSRYERARTVRTALSAVKLIDVRGWKRNGIAVYKFSHPSPTACALFLDRLTIRFFPGPYGARNSLLSIVSPIQGQLYSNVDVKIEPNLAQLEHAQREQPPVVVVQNTNLTSLLWGYD